MAYGSSHDAFVVLVIQTDDGDLRALVSNDRRQLPLIPAADELQPSRDSIVTVATRLCASLNANLGFDPHSFLVFSRPWLLLDQAPAGFRHIAIFSHNNPNLSLFPVLSDERVVAGNFERYSFTTGELYDERTAISVLLEKLVTDNGRYRKYYPNVMLALFSSHEDAQSVHVSGEGLEESKCGEFKVVASTSATPAEIDLIRSGAVTSEELHMYADAYGNRQPFANVASTPVQDAHYQRMVDDAIAASQDSGDLQALDAHPEKIRYDANVLEAEHRSLQDMEYKRGTIVATMTSLAATRRFIPKLILTSSPTTASTTATTISHRLVAHRCALPTGCHSRPTGPAIANPCLGQRRLRSTNGTGLRRRHHLPGEWPTSASVRSCRRRSHPTMSTSAPSSR